MSDQIQEEMELVEEIEEIPGETKQEAFIRLVNKRLPVAVKRIRLLKNLASSNYDFTDAQAAAVIQAIKHETEKLEQAFLREDADDAIPVIE